MDSNSPILDAAVKLREMTYPIMDEFSFKACCSAAFGLMSWLVGGVDLPLIALIVLFLSDYFLGFYCAWRLQIINANKLWRGIGKFILYVTAVMTAHMLDLAMYGVIPGLDDPARNFMICYLALNEFLSASAHLAKLGMRVPPWLLSRLNAYRDIIDEAKICSK